MPLSLGQGVALANDTTLQARVALGFFYVARGVLAENPETYGHEQRERFARSIVMSKYEAFQQYTAMVVTDPTVVAATPANQAAITDAQIVAAVTASWNMLSNVDEA